MQRTRILLAPPISGGVAALALLFAGPELGVAQAQAQSWWGAPPPSYYRPRVQIQRARVPRRDVDRVTRGNPKKTSAEEVAASRATASGPLMAVVSLSSQRMTVYDSSGAIIRSPVSTGKTGHRTPTGVFSVIQKNRHHVSNIYSGAPMPYMQRITWSGIALHAGVLPGYPASAGCIRMPYPVAAKMFAMSKMGMRVIIAPHEPTPGAFAHPALPEPLMVAAPADTPATPRAEGDMPAVRVATAQGGADGAQVATRFLNPMQNAVVERGRARARVVEATRANKELLEASLRASAEANAAAAALRTARVQAEQLKSRADGASGEAKEQLDAQVGEVERRLAEAQAVEAAKSRAAYAAAAASRDAEEAQAAAEAAVKVADRGTEPIAVFISRREGKVYVRQGMTPLFEAPVTIKEPGRPLGTHVYQAMAADGATGRIGWKVVTVPESVGFSDTIDNRGPVRRGEKGTPSVGIPSDAKGALERVEMPEEARRKISERLWINGSLIISDHGISNETGKGTDFVVLTR